MSNTESNSQNEEKEENQAEFQIISLQLVCPLNGQHKIDGISPADSVLAVKQAIAELPETCFYTSYTLFKVENEGNIPMNDFLELSQYGLVDGSVLKMVLDDYDQRKARLHVRKFRDLLQSPPVPPSQFSKVNLEEKDVGISKRKKKQAKQEKKAKAEEKTVESDKPVEKTETEEAKPEPTEEEAVRIYDENKLFAEEAFRKEQERLREIREKMPEITAPLAFDLSKFYPTFVSSASSKDIISLEFKKQTNNCVKSVNFSNWNPPPPQRSLQGDLFYIEVDTLGEGLLNITASVKGFYVNGCKHGVFDPTPSTGGNAKFSHDLIALLQKVSPSFRSAWSSALTAASKKVASLDNPLTALGMLIAENKLDTATVKPQWNVPVIKSRVCSGQDLALENQTNQVAYHESDMNRSESMLLATYGMDERGSLRDWNEEIQSIRELPKATPQDRLLRSRMLQKAISDFNDAATQGAVAVINGQVSPINPADEEKSHVYVFNNIFFSRAAETKENYRASSTGGDASAFKSCLQDMRAISTISAVDLDTDVHTLATAIIDYMGIRLVAQSLIPGILQGDQSSKLAYGAVETGQEITSKPVMHKLMKDIGNRLLIAEREVPAIPIAKKEGSISLFTTAPGSRIQGENVSGPNGGVMYVGPIECKGIEGADRRLYILDLIRVTPVDPNWSSVSTVYDKTWGCDLSSVCLFRQELVAIYARNKLLKWRESKLNLKNEERSKETNETKADNNEQNNETNENGDTYTPEEEESFLMSLSFNVNVFLPVDSCLNNEQKQADEDRVKEAALYLWNEMLPAVTADVKTGNILPFDGDHLTSILHSYGINIRYLGRLAELASVEEKNDVVYDEFHSQKSAQLYPRFSMPIYWLELLEVEMVARCARHVFCSLLSDRSDIRRAPALFIVKFLNLLTGKHEQESSKKKTKKSETTELTFASLWDMIKKSVAQRFRYNLQHWGNNETNGKRANKLVLLRRFCQKTGLRIYSKDYNFSTSNVFCVDDLFDVVPVSYYSVQNVPFNDANDLIEAARLHLSASSPAIAYELTHRASLVYQQIIGGNVLHPEVANCLEIQAAALRNMGDSSSAAIQQLRSLALRAQLHGVDSAEVIVNISSAARMFHTCDQSERSINLFKAKILFIEMIGGDNHPEIANTWLTMAQIYQEATHLEMAARCYNEALRLEGSCGYDRFNKSRCYHGLALIHAAATNVVQGLKYERLCYNILLNVFGSEDERTVESGEHVKQFFYIVSTMNKRDENEKVEQSTNGEEKATTVTPPVTKPVADNQNKSKKKKNNKK